MRETSTRWGTPKADAEKVFIRLFKSRDIGGTGTGLATVEKTDKSCGVKIRACNDGGPCLEFIVRGEEAYP